MAAKDPQTYVVVAEIPDDNDGIAAHHSFIVDAKTGKEAVTLARGRMAFHEGSVAAFRAGPVTKLTKTRV